MGHFLVCKIWAAPGYFPRDPTVCSCSSDVFILFQAFRYPFKDIYKTKGGGGRGLLGKISVCLC